MQPSRIVESGRADTGPRNGGIGMKAAVTLVVAMAVLLGGCSIFRGNGEKSRNKNRIPGERISVLSYEGRLTADPRISDLKVTLPKPYENKGWPEAGGDLDHVMQHLELASNPKIAWEAKIGKGSGGVERLIASPVVANGIVYTLDANNTVEARHASDGKRLWKTTLRKKGEKKESGIGGGVSYHDGVLYVTSGFGFVSAVDAKSGKEIWRKETGVPMRGAPTIADGRIFALSYDNQLFAMTTSNGDIIWNSCRHRRERRADRHGKSGRRRRHRGGGVLLGRAFRAPRREWPGDLDRHVEPHQSRLADAAVEPQ